MNPQEVFLRLNTTDLSTSMEARIKKAILSCDLVSREIVFSSNESIKNLRVEQEVRLNSTLVEKHSFRFGFVIPGSTNTWEQTFSAAEGRISDPDLLSGNLEILITFSDGNKLIKRVSLAVYYV